MKTNKIRQGRVFTREAIPPSDMVLTKIPRSLPSLNCFLTLTPRLAALDLLRAMLKVSISLSTLSRCFNEELSGCAPDGEQTPLPDVGIVEAANRGRANFVGDSTVVPTSANVWRLTTKLTELPEGRFLRMEAASLCDMPETSASFT